MSGKIKKFSNKKSSKKKATTVIKVTQQMTNPEKEGYHIIHFVGGHQIVGNYKNGKIYTVNLDGIDPDGFEEPMLVPATNITVVEPISEKRFHNMREMALRAAQTRDVHSILQLKQIIQAGKQAGVILDAIPAPAPEPEPEKKPSLQRVPQETTLEPPAESPEVQQSKPIAPKMIGVKQAKPQESYDGAVVEIPAPKRR